MGLRVLLLLLAVFHGASARRTRVQEQEFKEALLRGVRLSTSGDQRAALEAFEAAAALAPGDPAALQNVGVMAMQLGDATRAASAFEAALAATPTNPAGLLSGLGQVRCEKPVLRMPLNWKLDSGRRRYCSWGAALRQCGRCARAWLQRLIPRGAPSGRPTWRRRCARWATRLVAAPPRWRPALPARSRRMRGSVAQMFFSGQPPHITARVPPPAARLSRHRCRSW